LSGADGQVLGGGGRLAAWANFVKVAHTVFALPFACLGMVAASLRYEVDWARVALAVLAFAAARFAAMGFNRIVDLRYDAANPRTAGRELPSGRMSVAEARTLVALMCGIFFVSVAFINPLCLILSPVALAWILAYSYTKRYTALCHIWLGLGLAIAPVGGYLAISGEWSTPGWVLLALTVGVAAWVAGFDTIYSLQDEEFDRQLRLNSLAVALGARGAVAVARILHVVAIAGFVAFGMGAGFGAAYQVGVAAAALALAWEHRLVRPGDYSRLDAAFFTMNGVVAAVVLAGAVVDVL
jgi:4-hydroxybenzoate polyprenyltransferase